VVSVRGSCQEWWEADPPEDPGDDRRLPVPSSAPAVAAEAHASGSSASGAHASGSSASGASYNSQKEACVVVVVSVSGVTLRCVSCHWAELISACQCMGVCG
jgi:hypothetical protein